MVVVLDDRGDVWNWCSNLIKVHPYNFFIGIGDINEPATIDDNSKSPQAPGKGKAALAMTKKATDKERPVLVDNDTELKYVMKAMNTLHKRFYDNYSNSSTADVCQILPSLKHKVLEGINIVFSGIIPLFQDPSHNEFWILAAQFGATCSKDINANTTHLIASKVFLVN